MDRASPPDLHGESARILAVLRHALAGPLSAAALKLALVERRLLSPSGSDPSWLLERLRALQADLGATTRLLDLLQRLAEIRGERPRKASLRDVCRRAGIPLDAAAAASPCVTLRVDATADALRSVAAVGAGLGSTAEPTAREGLRKGGVTLALEGLGETSGGRLERLLDLPQGSADAEALFVARAAVAADGGRLELTERAGRLVALFSWPLDVESGAGRNEEA